MRTFRTFASGGADDSDPTMGGWRALYAVPPSTTKSGWCEMGAKSDQTKGKAKEAAGILSGNKDLESEGKADHRKGEVKEKIDHAKDKLEDLTDKAGDALRRK